MPAERLLPSTEAEDLVSLAREIAREELAPLAAEYEEQSRFPREQFRLLGKSGLLGLPYPERWGGGDVPYEVYLQVLEEIATAWMSVGVGLSVHTMSCYALAHYGTDEQRDKWLPAMLGGDLLGAYALSEPHAGSDAAALSTRAVHSGDEYVINGTKAWITHGGEADFYTTMVRTSPDGGKGITCLLVDAETEGLSAAEPEKKMGMTASTTAQMIFDDARVPVERRIGDEGQGLRIALESLASGRLGIAACAVGLAQAALDEAKAHVLRREQFGRPLIELGAVGQKLAQSWTDVEAARAFVYRAASLAKSDPLGHLDFSSMAKVHATEAAAAVVDRSLQVMGRFGLVRGSKIERLYRNARPLRIYEGATEVLLDSLARRLAKGGR